MTAPARLLALRLQGFKSFAERTVVEFGPGISAVVGPNGSGKSNLADGLRWALGEQGRALRSRKAEDVIWAGSDRRAALGMADVTLVLDNADGLLPVDYSVLELGRRLYRSGENDYLLNRQRVRLRDLVDLLDAANLADNAFLFIGQGMVDQALSLRPEERRPLFEEVAGVRRHERRRRKAEEQVAESEANLARVEDILGELRPQARRLAAQAEQQATRATAGSELANGLILAAHHRWHEAAGRLAQSGTDRGRAGTEAERAGAALRTAEHSAAAIAAELTTRVAAERDRRAGHERARAELTALQLREARLISELEASLRDRQRLSEERAAAEADLAAQRRAEALPAPQPDLEAIAALTGAERSLADAVAELGRLRAASRAHGEELAAVRHAEAAREAELETARRRLAEAERRATEERAAAEAAAGRRNAAATRLEAATRAWRETGEVEAGAIEAREAARVRMGELELKRQAAAERASNVGSIHASLAGRLDALESRLREEEARGIARAARRHGGRRVDEDLAVEPDLRAAVEAALVGTLDAYLVERGAVEALAAERGTVIVRESAAAQTRAAAGDKGVKEQLVARGGGMLGEAIRRDPTGAVTSLLSRAAWLPDLRGCVAMQGDLPAGWVLVPRDGSAVVSSVAVSLGAPDALLERRAQQTRLGAELARLVEDRARVGSDLERATVAADEARAALEAARAAEAAAAADRRRAEEAERLAARDMEAVAREAAWHAAQTERLDAEAAAARDALGARTERAAGAGQQANDGDPADDALGTWERRVEELRRARDGLAGGVAVHDAVRRESESRRARAEAAAAIDEERIARADREAATLAERSRETEAEREALRTSLAAAVALEASARTALDELLVADTSDRERLASAERGAAEARDHLRGAEDRLRAADRTELEARLGLDSLREQVLVELAGLGALGRRHLAAVVDGQAAEDDSDAAGGLGAETDADHLDEATEADVATEAAALETALDRAVPGWVATLPGGEAPSSGRLAALRRRYHEVGAANPFAVEEYAAVRARLETLDSQATDLRAAIVATRRLIEELGAMIAEQFSTTFHALEAAFDRRFNQLFGGGYAKLALTDPDDPSASGIEIVARPPGKKAQALAMLSGGERALTAVALLFAMLEVRPVPFCVLDEVDAALDEANVGRFSDALRGLADQTQFVVITHNRGTIEAADALYGVTVGDDSVSRVISLRLEEARAIADLHRPSEPATAAIG